MKKTTSRTTQKKYTQSNVIAYLIGFLIVAQLAVLSLLYYRANNLTNTLDTARAELSKQMSEVDYQKSLQRPAVLAKENLVAFPELGITLPYNDITKTLQYTFDNEGNLRVTSTLLTDHKDRQLSCSELVRVNVKDGTPYSPWEEKAGSVTLSNGRTANIFAAKAFKNNQASSLECASEVWTHIKPQQVADEFKKAQAL